MTTAHAPDEAPEHDLPVAPDAPTLDPVDPAAYLRSFRGETLRKATTALTEGSAYVTTRALAQAATPHRNVWDAARWWRHVLGRRRPTWSTEHEIVWESPIARLRDFSAGATDDVVPTLVLPPQAGHDSCIVDFAPTQSQMQVIRQAGLTRAFTLDWVGATQQTKGTTVEDYVAIVDRAVDSAVAGTGHTSVNLVGDCQGGWLSAIYAALHPDRVNTLTLAGAPIDFHAGDTAIGASSRVLSRRFGTLPYRAMVAMGRGNMPGQFVLNGFIAMSPDSEIAKHVDLLRHLDDPAAIARYQTFEDWFKHTQDVPGTFYLWLVEHLFAGNELITGDLVVGGKRVDLAALDCPLFLLGGATDHITPPVQVFRAADGVSTPPEKVWRRTAPGGHLGLFMGNQALREEWPPIMTEVARFSGVTAASTA
ncbi:alpha/beta fold hydrolase [Actinomycetospora endophytica]|uniref:Alpha/beta fold hydrolase n=1 Tax=Actinomycetospora endophytica TaxID=2291215 RepID=A0ABS8P1Z9_9PSEU|nr:alpha/beta fold hydrolase [Actinomycetospora endophytica]MCD2192276.1 alpha/beta fold hydrolase [Actinomycetospora endophytica]